MFVLLISDISVEYGNILEIMIIQPWQIVVPL